MGATKRMMLNNPDLFGICHRPELHWMEQEYLQSLKQKEDETIKEINVDFEIVSEQESQEEGSPQLGEE